MKFKRTPQKLGESAQQFGTTVDRAVQIGSTARRTRVLRPRGQATSLKRPLREDRSWPGPGMDERQLSRRSPHRAGATVRCRTSAWLGADDAQLTRHAGALDSEGCTASPGKRRRSSTVKYSRAVDVMSRCEAKEEISQSTALSLSCLSLFRFSFLHSCQSFGDSDSSDTVEGSDGPTLLVGQPFARQPLRVRGWQYPATNV